MRAMRYLANLTKGRVILWCYFIWYAVVLSRYFDASPRLWFTSLGLSAIIGTALYISTTSAENGRTTLGGWQIFRLFLMPFCVSSFAALVKGRSFILIFSPIWHEDMIAVALCISFVLAVAAIKRSQRKLF